MTLWDRFFYIKVFFINTPSAVSFCAKMRMPIFNLGWLPRSDKVCVTKPETTVAALEAAVGLIDKSFGYLSIASYRGHAGGEEECEAVRKFFSKIKNARTEEAASSDDPKSPVLFTAKFVI